MLSSRTRSSRAIAAVAAAAAALPLLALTQVPGPIRIGPSWGQSDENDHSASLYTTVINRGVLADRLAGGACPGFGQVSLVGLDAATQGSRPQDRGVFLAPGASATLSANGPHLTIANAQRSVADGSLIACTLDFVHSGQRIVVFAIGPEPGRTDEP